MGGSAQLNALQRRVLALATAHGAFRLVVGISAASVLLSVTFTLLFLLLTGTSRMAGGLLMSAVIPAVLAPLGSWLAVAPMSALGKAYRDLEVVASTDSLTGLANRLRFFSVAEALFAQRLPSTAVVVGMVDLDYFKRLNDSEGHAVGDAALVTVARALRDAVGSDGLVGRIGGDEFALLVPVPVEDTAAALTLMRAIEGACSRLTVRSGVLVDASVGLRLVSDVDNIDEALRLADEALYVAKANRPARQPTPVPRSA